MQCPVCSAALRQEKFENLAFEVCSKCRGIWVAGDQFRALAVRVATEGDIRPKTKLTFEPRKVLQPPARDTVRLCPSCRQSMKEFNYAYDSNIFLDRCEQCRRIWMDPNEIIEIAAHIQYDPDAMILGRSLLEFGGLGKMKEDTDCFPCWLEIAFIILQKLIFLI